MDASYKFLYVDVGAAGHASDAGVYGQSTLKTAIASNTLSLPRPTPLPKSPEFQVNYHIVGDDAFPMSENLMKPYPQRNLEPRKRIFNYRLSRARRVVENAFGILAHRWRVFLTIINMCPDKLTYLIFAACCLHNYLAEKNKSTYASTADVENADHTIRNGTWRNDARLSGLQSSLNHNPPTNAKEQREMLTTYFNNNGSVPWQDSMIV